MIIKGEVRTIIYQNKENDYKVLAVDIGNEEVTITGTFGEMAMDIPYEFHVSQREHALYGTQYVTEAYRLVMPSEASKIEQFLASGIFDGIGPSLASRIVSAFGDTSLEVMRSNSVLLKNINGIGDATYDKIMSSFKSHLDAEETLFFLNGLGLSAKQSFKIYEAYGIKTQAKIKKNPYRILHDIKGIGFKTVDRIAVKLGFTKRSEERLKALVVYILDREANNGHIFICWRQLYSEIYRLSGVTETKLHECIQGLNDEGYIYLEKIEDEMRVYSSVMYETEIGIVRELARLKSAFIENVTFKANLSDLDLSEEQQVVVDGGLEAAVYILTGGPGTGKTTILKEWVYRLEAADKQVVLCAPTGRAASRMEEVVGRSASTVHRLLEYAFQEDSSFLYFHRNRENPLESDAVIVDEFSMMDAPLFLKLLQATKTGARLILIGDVNQLPAVGPGNVLSDLIASNFVATAKLTHIHRQAADSLILNNAHAMLNHSEMIFNQKDKDFYFIQTLSQVKILDTLLDVVNNRIPNYYKVNAIEEITVLTPIRNGRLGAEGLNKSLQNTLNPTQDALIYGKYQPGDKVMQNKNNYNIKWIKAPQMEEGEGVFNGEIGRVDGLGTKGMFVVFQDGKRVCYTKDMIDDLVLAYAMTIHKSQGNEFDYVVIPIFNIPDILKSKNLIYTAITRAKKQVTLIGDRNIFKALVHSNKVLVRNSSLAERLIDVSRGMVE